MPKIEIFDEQDTNHIMNGMSVYGCTEGMIILRKDSSDTEHEVRCPKTKENERVRGIMCLSKSCQLR